LSTAIIKEVKKIAAIHQEEMALARALSGIGPRPTTPKTDVGPNGIPKAAGL